MREAVIVSACRTPVARAGPKSYFKDVRADDLSIIVIKELLRRTKIDPKTIEDVIWGCAMTTNEQGMNIARMIGLMAGLPVEVAGMTIDRFCASSLQAINSAAQAIMTGGGDIIIAGGGENMTQVPMGTNAKPNPKIYQAVDASSFFMGQTAENLSDKYKEFTREEIDKFALRSHQKAVAAQREGKFKKEIVPVEGILEDGTKALIDTDQHPRPDTSLEKLANLKLAFRPPGTGTVTAGNSSGLNDNASGVVVTSKEKAKELGLRPLCTIRAMAVVGVPAEIMGIGPVYAIPKVLKRGGMKLEDIDIFEINEAFAVQVLVCIKELGLEKALEEDRINPNGGAVAIGHPLGATGARIMCTLLYEMERRNARWGLETMCVGMGQGAATIVEREDYDW